MKLPRVPHRWDVTPARAAQLQRELAARVILRPLPQPVRYVAGLDAAFSGDGRWCVAAAVVWDVAAQCVVEAGTAACRLWFPYVPGLLSFREAPALLAALRKLRARPEVLMCDGHGLAHPRRFGIACHVGLLAGLPAVGCAKSLLVGEHEAPARVRGARSPLMHRGTCVGSVLRTRDGVRPVYVSVGHLADQPTAERLVLDCGAGYRLPEPTRRADHLVRITAHPGPAA